MIKKKNVIWNMMGITANAFISLFLLIIVRRINGITLSGVFSYAFSLACLFYVVAVYYNRVYQVADVENSFSINEYLTSRFLTSFITSILIILFCVINGFTFFKSIIIILLTLFKIVEDISDCYYGFIQKKDDLAYIGKSLFFKSLIGVLTFLIVDIFTKNLILSILMLIIVNFIIMIIDIKKFYTLYKTKFYITIKNVPKLLKETLPVFLFTFLNIFLCNCQKYVIEYFLEDSFQTIFAVIVMPATFLSLCGPYILMPFLNYISKLYSKKDIKNMNNYVNKINGIYMIIGIAVFIIAFFLGVPVLNFIYDLHLENYKLSFMIIMAGSIAYGLVSMVSNILTVIKRNKEQLYIYIISSVIALVSSILLIKNFALSGAAFAYSITMILHCLMCYLMLKYYLKK